MHKVGGVYLKINLFIPNKPAFAASSAQGSTRYLILPLLIMFSIFFKSPGANFALWGPSFFGTLAVGPASYFTALICSILCLLSVPSGAVPDIEKFKDVVLLLGALQG